MQCILQNMDQDLALEFMPETRSTVLHYVCIHRSCKVYYTHNFKIDF